MAKRIPISTIAAFLIGGVLVAPSPDPISMLVLGVGAAFLCAIPLLVLSRFSFMKSASTSVHTLVCVLVCMVAVLSVMCFTLAMLVRHRQEVDGRALVSSQPQDVALAVAPSADE